MGCCIQLFCMFYNLDGIIFSNLSCLKLYGGYSSREDLLAVRKFLAMIPKLELLCFELTNRSSYYEIGDDFLDNPLSVPQWKLSSIITFCCKGFMGLRDEMEHFPDTDGRHRFGIHRVFRRQRILTITFFCNY